MNASLLTRGAFTFAVIRRLLAVISLSLLPALADTPAGDIERRSVQSSDLAAVGYDAKRRLLEIEFRSGGIYRYLEVPPQIHEQLLAADSKGRFFATHIRDQFRCERVKARASAAR
jgi:hypothetical protein